MEPAEPSIPNAHSDVANPQNLEGEEFSIEASIQEAEELLHELKTRYSQVKAAQSRKPELEARVAELETELKDKTQANNADLKAELESIKNQLFSTWEELESQLITWRDKQELFWQFLRFAGIGFIAAFILHRLVK
jgi:predicted nuclease with TOPRIM domain